MIVETVAVLSGIKHAIDIGTKAKEAISLSDKQERIDELLAKLIDIKISTLELIEENRLLKIECDKHAQFELERACYVLHELAPGVLVYKFNPGVGDLDEQVATPNHYLCANCYEQGKKGYMQRFSQDHTGTHYRCSSCGSPVVDHVNKAQISIDVVSTGARRSSITYGY